MAGTKLVIFVGLASLFVLAFASGLPSEDDDVQIAGRAKRAIVKPQKIKKAMTKRVNCKGTKFAPVKKCCRENLGNFFLLSSIQSCSNDKVDSKLISYSSYHLNTLFNSDNNLDLDDPRSIKDITTVSCIIECLFRDQKLLTEDGTKIDYVRAAEFLAKAAPDRYKAAGAPPATDAPIMELIATGCGKEIDDLKLGTVTSKAGGTCSKDPMMFIQCVRQTILAYCPPSLAIKSSFCDTNVPMLKSCAVFNTTVTFK